MIQAVEKPIQAPATARGNADALIVGGGIFGLWAARHAIRRGETAMVLEKRRIGAGASGGFLGALMPHMPDRWNAKKQFQFEALSGIGDAIAELEADTGLACGFRRCGRLIPVRSERTLPAIEQRLAGAQANWPGQTMELVDPDMVSERSCGWLDAEQAPFGAVHDTLSARVDPRAYLAALAACARARGTIAEGADVVTIDPAGPCVTLATGETVSAGRVVVAAGWESYVLLAPFMGEMTETNGPYANGLPGRGVKGQAVLLDHAHEDAAPILYEDGVYVVPHAGDRVAIGSTTVENWQQGRAPAPDRFDEEDMAFHQRALRLVPALNDAAIAERWANVRPRNMLKGRGTEPFMGPVPGHDRLSALIGGFKIGLGVAHMAAGD